MAKNGSKIATWVRIIIALIVLASAGIAFLVKVDAKAEGNVTDIADLKEDGCKPAQKIGVIEYRLDAIDTRQEAMQKENSTAFKEILERLPKK